MNNDLLAEIVDHIKERYGSLESPHFSFVAAAIARRPFAAVEQRIAECFTCQEDTDPNDDVSFGYILRRQDGRWVLRLSMVGPYALLLRERRGGIDVLTPSTPDLSEPERHLLRLLTDEGIMALDREMLRRSVPLRVPDRDAEPANVYQALFTETDVFPWERLPVPI